MRINRPSLLAAAQPPELRSARGADFTAANLASILSLQHCDECQSVNYPPSEVCYSCLSDQLSWKETDFYGHVLQAVELHHSLSEFFKQGLEQGTWPIATIKLAAGPTVFAHIAVKLFAADDAAAIAAGTKVSVFSHADAAGQAVLLAVPASTPIETTSQRHDLADAMGLLVAASRAT